MMGWIFPFRRSGSGAATEYLSDNCCPLLTRSSPSPEMSNMSVTHPKWQVMEPKSISRACIVVASARPKIGEER